MDMDKIQNLSTAQQTSTTLRKHSNTAERRGVIYNRWPLFIRRGGEKTLSFWIAATVHPQGRENSEKHKASLLFTKRKRSRRQGEKKAIVFLGGEERTRRSKPVQVKRLLTFVGRARRNRLASFPSFISMFRLCFASF